MTCLIDTLKQEGPAVKRLPRLVFAFSGALTLALAVGASADSKLDITNWKDILPEPDYVKLVDESIKNLTSYTSSPSQFNQNAKKVQHEATNLIVYSEIAHRAGKANAGALRQAAQDLLAAAKAKKADDAKKLTTTLAGYKTLSAGKAEDADLTKATDLGLIMNGPVKDIDRNLTTYKRLTAASFGAKGKSEEVQIAMYKLAAMSVATTAHVPTADLPKGKTAKDWLASAEDMRKHSLAAAQAAKDKKLTDLKKAVNDLSAACAKCHDDFRVESN